MRDYLEVKKLILINVEVVGEVLELFNVDFLGLDWIDCNLLRMMIENYNGGFVGLEIMVAVMGEDV